MKKGIFPIIFERFKTLGGYIGRSRHAGRGSAKSPGIGAHRRPRNYYQLKKSRRRMATLSRRANRC
jgi:hypothetical protein